MANALVDAGPLVALVDADEPAHHSCLKAVREESAPLLTVWPAVTEALHLLQQLPKAQQAILDMLDEGSLELAALGREDIARIRWLMAKYRDHPMDLADAALVRVAEREQITRILTLDRRDFSAYRAGRWGPFTILP